MVIMTKYSEGQSAPPFGGVGPMILFPGRSAHHGERKNEDAVKRWAMWGEGSFIVPEYVIMYENTHTQQ